MIEKKAETLRACNLKDVQYVAHVAEIQFSCVPTIYRVEFIIY